jgi:hypothetical protein
VNPEADIYRPTGHPFRISGSERKWRKLNHQLIEEIPPDAMHPRNPSWRKSRIYDAKNMAHLGLRHRRRNLMSLRATVRQMEARTGPYQVKGYTTRSGKRVRSYRRS